MGESKSLIPIEAITRVTPDAIYISHTLEHVAGAPRYDPKLVPTELEYFFNLFPYYGYAPSFGLPSSMVTSKGAKSEESDESDESAAKDAHR
jgi:hypothetical protein